MKPSERDELLVRLDERTGAIAKDIIRIEGAVNGHLESHNKTRRGIAAAIGAGIAGVGAAVASWFRG